MTWQSNALLVVSSAFLCAALVLTGLAVFQRPNNPLKKLSNFIKRKNRERKQTYWLLTQGGHGREEEGVRKHYKAGELIGLSEKELAQEKEWERTSGSRRMTGPIDVKAWNKLDKKKKNPPEDI
jgi:hypothetical protein